jgi:hypothetical protein
MRPALRAGLLPLWRDHDTIQVGVDPRRATALTGAGSAAPLLGLLDGSRDRTQLIDASAELGVPRPVAERMLTLLAAADVLIDFPAGLVRELPPELRRRLGPQLAATSVARQDSDGGAETLARRGAASVHLHGRGRIATLVAEVLTASGVGVSLIASADGRLTRDHGPGELVILVGQVRPETADELRCAGVPHLAVAADEAIGTVGPLVRPGLTACIRCLHLTRAERDPAWPLILAQIQRRRSDPPACDAALAAAVAAQAAAQALAFIDRPGAAGPAENATLELVQPGWQWQRRGWAPHRACTCRAAA